MAKLAVSQDDIELFTFPVEDRGLAPEFEPGEVVIVDPNGHIFPGCYVVVAQQGKNKLCRYLARDGVNCLQCSNEQYLDCLQADISGVVIYKGKQYN